MKKLKLKRTNQDSRKSAEKPTNPNFLRRKKPPLSNVILLENRPVRKLRRRVLKQHVIDARTLSATALRNRYRLTYDSWRNMKQRTKQGAIIAPEFMSFADFIQHVGPRPRADYTLDRIDNNNRTYGPRLCEWRDKKAQANNRSTTILLTYKDECHPLTIWAKRTNQSADTMRKRRLKGWTDIEVIEGKKFCSAPEDNFTPDMWPGDLENQARCECVYNKYKSEQVQCKRPYFSRLEYLERQCKWRVGAYVEYFCTHYDNYEYLTADEKVVYHQKTEEYERLKAVLRKCDAAKPKEQKPERPLDPPKWW